MIDKDPNAPIETATCEEASKVVTMMRVSAGANDLEKLFLTRCHEDDWTAATRVCMKRATTRSDGQSCVDALSNDQRRRLGSGIQRTLGPE